MALSTTQIPLSLDSKDHYHFANFYFSQAELQQALQTFIDAENINFLYIWAEQGAGKSHLLFALSEQAQQQNKRVLYLPLAELVKSDSVQPEILNSVEHLDLLCIDDLDAIAELSDWQEALFHCFNRLQQSQCKLVIASHTNPAMTDLSLADLRSRLATALIYQLASLNDDEKQQALILQAQARGLTLSDDVARYLLRHHSRDMRELMVLLQQLDHASLSEKRRLTLPFVRAVLHG